MAPLPPAPTHTCPQPLPAPACPAPTTSPLSPRPPARPSPQLPSDKQRAIAEQLDRTPGEVLKKLEDIRNRVI